ncbi:hypothetical protein B7494_g1285 [Chlorociboria aeruginascens]|nr:hypothetical protein B7494_g1285 [Chlorociboria aeruginascens]
MTSFEDVSVPRKRITTYGKAAVRKRVPDYNFASFAQRSKAPESAAQRTGLLGESGPLDLKQQKLKTVPQRSTSTTSSPSSPAPRINGFDVPSSDDEPALAKQKPIHKINQTTAQISELKATTTKSRSVTSVEDVPEKKRRKLSPIRPSLISMKNPVKQAAAIEMTQISQKHQRTQGIPQLKANSIVSRPKPKLTARPIKPAGERAPQKVAPAASTSRVVPSTPPPQPSDVVIKDADFSTQYISPKAQRIWNDLLEVTETSEVDIAGISTVQPPPGSSTTAQRNELRDRIPKRVLFQPAGISKQPQKNTRNPPRRRLIDALAEQAQDDPEEDDADISDAEVKMELAPIWSQLEPGTDRFIPSNHVSAPELPVLSISATQGSQNVGPKFTYSRQRSMLEEQDFMQQLAADMPSQPISVGNKSRRGSIPTLMPLPSFREEENSDDGGAETAVRSFHELRQAGANSRFLDEVDDFIERIGNPTTTYSSMRRSALVDLASKMKDRVFLRQFRANGFEQRLFVHLGQEVDIIAGFMMVSLLIAVLVDANMPHIVAQLRRQGVTRLIIRLLETQTSILAISKERKSNMSKMAQALLSEHYDFLLQMPIWEDLKPLAISPRTAALKCLELMVRQSREAGNAGDIISKELTTNLFQMLKSVSDEKSWTLPSGEEAINFSLALSTLESHSITARTVHDELIWINDYLPIIADTVETALSRPVEDFGMLQVLLLRLTLNVTNNNPRASDVFARESLMAVMGRAIAVKFHMISRFLTEKDFSVAMDQLILLLGVMINFAEWSPSSRESLQSLQDQPNDPLDKMIQIFVDNKERTSEAESVEESQKNVAFGYLSVLLGYFALLPAISERIRSRQPRKTLIPLVASVEEFIGHHKTVDDLFEGDEDGYSPHTGLTERLESLDEYSILNSKHFIGIHGYMIVYSIGSKQSFEMVEFIRDKILNHLGTDWVPIVVVGNKSDLPPPMRQVPEEEGKELPSKFKCAQIEASARHNENVTKAFELMIGQIEDLQDPNEPAGGGKCEVM